MTERYRRREIAVEEALVEMYLGASPCIGSKTPRRPCGARDGLTPQPEDLRKLGARGRSKACSTSVSSRFLRGSASRPKAPSRRLSKRVSLTENFDDRKQQNLNV